MKLLVFILNKIELQNELLKKLIENDVNGGTIIESKGMGRELLKDEEFHFFGSLSKIINPERKKNTTMLFALPAEKIETVIKIINQVVGDLSEPDTGVVFTLPIDFIQGNK